RKIESEVRALQRAIFPNGDGRFFEPEVVTPGAQPGQRPVGIPSETAVTDILARLGAIEAQLAQLTGRSEESAYEISRLEERIAALEAPPVQPAAGGQPSGVITPPGEPAQPSPERVAAVGAIEKPATGDSGEDEYVYGFRLWDAGFFPEA